MTFSSIDKRSIAEQIVEKLLDMIKQKQLVPGDKLPPERELAATLEVSRPSLREALRALSIMHIIEIQQGGGAYISSLEPKILIEHLDFILALDNSAVLQLFEARRILEVGIIDLAVQRITDDDVAALEANIKRTVAALDAPERFLEADIELHDRIASASGNPMLVRLLTSLSQLSRAGRLLTVQVDVMREQTIKDHERIVAALKARDPDTAHQAMIDHLNNSEQELREVITLHNLDDTDEEKS